MSAEQRRLFEESLAEDEASLQAQLQQAKGEPSVEDNTRSTRKPRRQPLPAHLRRVEHHHEPEDTHCPTPGCGRTMVRVGED
ncbi:IS66 family transposase, partial [Pseudomonas sp. GW460-13]